MRKCLIIMFFVIMFIMLFMFINLLFNLILGRYGDLCESSIA